MKENQLARLMQQQNELLEQQNILLEQLVAQKNSAEQKILDVSENLGGRLLDGEQVFVRDLWRDEIRDGFAVTANRKRLWNIQINLIKEFARICQKYNLRWFAYAGTLLGTVRHKGFIPWDDDVDICMFRPDYEKFKQIVKSEIKPPYIVDAWYDHHLEDEEPHLIRDNTQWQVVPTESRKRKPLSFPLWQVLKIRDDRTTMIQWPERYHVLQGIWIDIFPLDPVPPFENKRQSRIFGIQREMLFAIVRPDLIREELQKSSYKLIMPRDEMEHFLSLTHREKAAMLDDFSLKNFSKSKFVGEVHDFGIVNWKRTYDTKIFDRTVYLPFEETELPAPERYEDCLTAGFGDWRTPVFKQTHTNVFFTADFSYREFFKKIKFIPISG